MQTETQDLELAPQKELDDRIKADLKKRADDERMALEEQMAKVKKQIDDELEGDKTLL